MLRFDVIDKPIDIEAFTKNCRTAEKVLANEVLKDTRPFVPALTEEFSNNSHVEGNVVIYPAPFARYLYYGKVMVDSATGLGAFYIKDVGFRFRYGAILTATDKDLVFTKEKHPNAQAHWFEASKAQNLKKWERIADKAVKKYG